MVINGFKRPLVQEDMWELNEKDSTSYISQRFEETMKEELRKARQKLQEKQSKKKTSTPKLDHEQNGLAQGVSQDILVMVILIIIISFISFYSDHDKYTHSIFIYYSESKWNSHPESFCITESSGWMHNKMYSVLGCKRNHTQRLQLCKLNSLHAYYFCFLVD